MINEEQLYDAFGELLYAVAKSEGKTRGFALEQLDKVVRQYEWGSKAMWSFNYENLHDHKMEEAYDKAFDAFTSFGPFKGYKSFFDMLDAIVKMEILGERGQKVINRFRNKLLVHFAENQEIYFPDTEEA